MECYRGAEGRFYLLFCYSLSLCLFLKEFSGSIGPQCKIWPLIWRCFHTEYLVSKLNGGGCLDTLLPGRQPASHFPKHVENTDEISQYKLFARRCYYHVENLAFPHSAPSAQEFSWTGPRYGNWCH